MTPCYSWLAPAHPPSYSLSLSYALVHTLKLSHATIRSTHTHKRASRHWFWAVAARAFQIREAAIIIGQSYDDDDDVART